MCACAPCLLSVGVPGPPCLNIQRITLLKHCTCIALINLIEAVQIVTSYVLHVRLRSLSAVIELVDPLPTNKKGRCLCCCLMTQGLCGRQSKPSRCSSQQDSHKSGAKRHPYVHVLALPKGAEHLSTPPWLRLYTSRLWADLPMQGQSLPLSLASTRLTMLLTASLNFSSSVKMGMLSPTTLSTRLSPIACSDIACQQSAVLPLLKREKQRICHSHQGVMSRPDLDLPVACSVTLGRADAVSCPLLIRDPSCCHCSTSCPSSSAQAACVPRLL